MGRKTGHIRKSAPYLVAALAFAFLSAAVAPMNAQAAAVPLHITVSQTAPAEHSFSYVLKPLKASNPMPPGSAQDGYAFSIVGQNSVKLGPMSFNRHDVYRYQVLQTVQSEKQGYTYDRRVYTVEVRVDEALNTILLVFNADGSKAESIRFENAYRVLPSDPALMRDPPVKKTVSGKAGYSATFEFKLVAMETSYPMPAGSVNGVKTLHIRDSGQGEFGTWRYDKAGTYHYTVYEVNGGLSGYTYDTTVYTITDIVKDENGRLVATREVRSSVNKSVSELAFLNHFSEGKDGPKTGDDTDTALLYALFALGGAAVPVSLIILLVGKRREKSGAGNRN